MYVVQCVLITGWNVLMTGWNVLMAVWGIRPVDFIGSSLIVTLVRVGGIEDGWMVVDFTV